MKTNIQKPIPAIALVLANHEKLCLLAFQNSLQANIISTVSNGKLIIVNNAASKLLGYSNKGLLTKYRSNIFDINESNFKKMLKQRTASGYSKALLTGIKKNGKQFPCEITSAVFKDERGITLSITTIADLSQSILKQKIIDTKNNKTVAANIVLAKSEQKIIDTNKEKAVADNILLAQSRSDARQAENNEHHKELEERFEQEIKLKQKQMTEAIEEAKETVRSHIGKELHDNINQLLAVSRMYLLMAKKGGANSQLFLTRSSEYTIKAIEEIRKLTKSLSADIINDLGLCDAIEGIGRDTMETNPLKIFYALSSFLEHSVGYKFKLNVLRIVQEHLNNILKHAKATEVNISLLQNKRAIILSISDNGIGFDTEKKQNGIGIANIKSRAIAYNGMAEFVSQTGNGCVLTARFMLTDPA